MSRHSSTFHAATEDAASEQGSGDVRFSTISCGLKRVLRHHDVLAPHFATYASSVGVMRHVVSMVANHIVLSGVSIEKGDVFLFYTRVWSAVDRHSAGIRRSNSHFDHEVSTFFEQHDCSALPDFKVPVLCRQQECQSLAIAAKEHLHTFPQRMMRWISAKIATFFWHRDGTCDADCKKDAGRLWKLLLSSTDENQLQSALRTFLQVERFNGVRDEIYNWMCQEYDHLASFREKEAVSLSKAIHTKKHAHLLSPHMRRVSVQCEELLESMGNSFQASEEVEELQYDEVIEEDDTEDESSTSSDNTFKWPKGCFPKPFCVFPNAKLKRAMVYYGATELKYMISNLCGGSKRKRDDIVTKLRECAMPEDMFPLLFDFKRVKGKHIGHPRNDAARWRLSNFRTDGIKVCVTFISGMKSVVPSPNVCCLVDAGYCIPCPTCDVDVSNTARGLFRVGPGRNDIAQGSVDSSNILTVVDPGFHRPIQTASISASELMSETTSAASLTQRASFDHVDYDTWMMRSGRTEREGAERRRRIVNSQYGHALDALSGVRKRSCVNYLSYTQQALTTLAARASELVAVERSLFRWKYERKLQSFLDKVADTLFCKTTKRACRRDEYRALDPDERKKLVQRLQEAKANVDARKHVVFFGDGTFSCTQRGHASIPKKRLLKQLAVRGLTFLLCERYTSLRCPCGHDDLKNGEEHTDGMRVRVHKTNGGTCDVLNNVKDRDELACTNMLLACATACRRAPWPAHLMPH